MNKDQFNGLEILEQIEYINDQLKNNKSITYVCKEIGVSRSTIRDRFKKIDYIFSKELNRYMYNNSRTNILQESTKSINSDNNRCITIDTCIEKNKSNTDVVQVDKVTDIINKSDIEIKETIIDIVNNYEVLKEIIELHRRNTSIIKQQIIIDIEESDSKLTTLRVNSKVLDKFNDFCKEYKQYKKVDLLSQALKEFIEKYK